MTKSPIPVVFIHGLWIHSDAWQEWVELYRAAGYDPTAPGWPGDSSDVERTRNNAAALANKGIPRHYTKVIDGLAAKPIVIGHSFGGLIAQKLLGEGRAAAAVAIDPGQIKGVRPLPFAQIRSGLPVLSKPSNKKKAVSLTKKQFRYGFGNALAEAESASINGPSPVRVDHCSRRPPPTLRRRRPPRSTHVETTVGRCSSSPAVETTPSPR